MLIDKELIHKAKEKLGDEMAFMIVNELEIPDFDEKNMKCRCPFHREDTPSFIWNKKTSSFHCFGACGRNYDIIDVYMSKGLTYIEAVKKLFDKAGVTYAFGEHKIQTKRQYRYPQPVESTDKSKVYEYLESRKISKETTDYLDIQQDAQGNVVFNYYDENDTLTMVKYRPSRKVQHGENKNWCQPGADTFPLLFNMNRINTDQPLAIFCGELDAASAVECGWHNAVSIPLGDQNFQWIEANFDWLEQFDQIIICPDNDESGRKFCKEVAPRLGNWRVKIAVVPLTYDNGEVNHTCKDANELLYLGGKNALLDIIVNAKDSPVDSVMDLSDVEDVDFDSIDGITMGIEGLDKALMKLFYGTLTVVSGSPGCVDRETEFFNGTQWKKICNYNDNDKVLQYNPDGTAELVWPMQYHKYPCKEFNHFYTNGGIDQMVSDDHNLVYYIKGLLQKRNVLDVIKMNNNTANGFTGKFPSTFGFDGAGVDISDDDIIRITTEHCTNGLDTALPKEWFKFRYEQFSIMLRVIIEYNSSRQPDSKLPKIEYHTLRKGNADLIQFAFATAGKHAFIDYKNHCYFVRVLSYGGMMNFCTRRGKGPREIPRVASTDGYKYCFTVPSGMLVLRRNNAIGITGNSGKTSFLYQIICQALDQGKNSWLYSKELPEWMTKNWFNFIFAGRRNIKVLESNKGADYYRVMPDAKKAINDEYRGKWFVYRDDYPNKLEDLIHSMTDVAKRWGVKLFVVDSLMTIDIGANENNVLQKQTQAINELIQFAMKYNVAVVLVAHPRKLMGTSEVGMYDIAGSSNIINLAHRTLGLRRVSPKEREGTPNRMGDGWYEEPIPYDVLLTVIKDRIRGRANYVQGMYYDIPSRRFYSNEKEYDAHYKWDTTKYTDKLDCPISHEDDEVFGRIEGK